MKGKRVLGGYLKTRALEQVVLVDTSAASHEGRRPDLTRVARSQWDAIFRHELMKKDPRGRKLTQILVRLHFQAPSPQEVARLSNQAKVLKRRLAADYGFKGIYVPPPEFLRLLQKCGGRPEDYGEHLWAPYGKPSLIFARGTGSRIDVRIDLTRTTIWDLESIVSAVKRCLRQRLKDLPLEVKRKVAPLEFVRTIRPSNFWRDLRRYDRHVGGGLSFRQIAALEVQERTGQAVADQLQPRRIGWPVRGEDSVERSVRTIYEAIHGTRYRARRRRLDSPAVGVDAYNCPEHGSECSKTCRYLRNWLARVRPTLPSDNTGMSPGKRLTAPLK